MIDRKAFLLAGATPATRIIEIGPSHAPIAAKADGWATSVLDHLDTVSLRAKYEQLHQSVEALEEVDFVWTDGPIQSAVPKKLHGSFDLLIASHVLEHIPDFLGFFAAAGELLGPDGSITLALPDKRFCFDCLKPLATTGDVLDAHLHKTSRHLWRTRWNQLALSVVTTDEKGEWITAWGRREVADLRYIEPLATAWHTLKDAPGGAAGPYEDAHAWVMTPASFELIMLELGQLGCCGWRVAEIHDCGLEFVVRLVRGAEVAHSDALLAERRMGLQRRMFGELELQIRSLRIETHSEEPLADDAAGKTSKALSLWNDFTAKVNARPAACILQLGARRAASGASILARDRFPQAGSFVGTDSETGEDVDVVANPHALSQVFPAEAFDAVISLSNLEHLKYPFVAAHEMMKLVRVGGSIFVQTHNVFPTHSEKEDYYRFSEHALRSLFSESMGIKIVGLEYEFPTTIQSTLGSTRSGYLNICLSAVKTGATPDHFVQETSAALPIAPGKDEQAALRRRLNVALRHHRAGELAAAAAAYRGILEADPMHADALHLLGLVEHAQGRSAEALTLIERATRYGQSARYFANLAMIEHQLGHYSEAVIACDRALALDPTHADAANTGSVARLALGDAVGALANADRALLLRPGFVEALINRGHALAHLERLEDARQAYVAGLALRPRPPRVPRRVLFVYNDPTQPGHIYRCLRMASAARLAGWDATAKAFADTRDEDVLGLEVLVLWRFEMSPRIARLMALARADGAKVGLDLDDLVIDPMMARRIYFDGIRSQGMTEADTQNHFARVQRLLLAVDFGTCSTEELGAQMRRAGCPVWVIENGFDEATVQASRVARRKRPDDGLFRIGYAGGTKTHQRDVARVAPALAAFLAARSWARLVLFRDTAKGEDIVAVNEFETLAPFMAQIEWRALVPLDELPNELARFDINIAPLETGNPFVEAKSELKFFEAALVGVPTIASPTGPYRRAIRHGVSGMLAESVTEWSQALEQLAASAEKRKRVAIAAERTALRRFSEGPRAASLNQMLHALTAGSRGVPT